MIAARMRRTPALGLAVLVCALVGPSAAHAQDPPQPGAATSQYRESIPAATGAILPGGGAAARTRLEPAVSHRLTREGGPDAGLLNRIATSSDYGAPQQAAPRGPRGEAPGDTARDSGARATPNALAAAGGALGHGGWRVLGLGVLMLATAASLAAVGPPGRQRAAGRQG